MLLRYVLAPLQSTLAWLPDWAVGLSLLVLAALAAAALHALTLGLLRRSIAPTQLFVRSLLTQTTAPTRFALVIFALGAALRSAPFDPGVRDLITQWLTIGFIVLLGWFQEIASTYVVVRVWDRRRLIVPLTYFIEKPFQNWTRQQTALIGSVVVYVDYAAPVERIRQQLTEIVSHSTLWDGEVASLQ